MGRISTAARQQFGERSFLKDMDCQQFKMDDVAPEARAAISGETATILSRDGKAIFLINRDGWKVDVDRNVAVTPVSEAQLRQMETLARVLGPFADQLENSRFPNEEAAEAAFMQAMEAMKGAP